MKAALLFAASKAPLDVAAGRVALEASADHFARYGILTIEDAAASLVLTTQGARALGAGAPINSDDQNLLATRSARLGDARLDFAGLQRMLADHDPLPALSARLEPLKLIRSLVRKSLLGRASTLADALPELSREIALGWVAASRGRPKLAQTHFGRALELAPD
ncbi:MAG: hypothetical protein O7G30_05445, partial [Proteobacteria bacterium]|nr:hypothetical protein [Pseudomonadota bacterium]